jgi:cytochrome oxidase assembly protein ShyY1
VFRTALRPRWLALLGVVLVAATVMAALGSWQLDRAREQGREAALRRQARPPVPVESVLPPRTSFPGSLVDRPVLATGHWDAARQLLVAGRRMDDVPGFWVLTPLRSADGTGVAVVRGWVGSAADPAARPPTTTDAVTVTGLLRAGEPAGDHPPGWSAGLPAGQVDRVDPADLVNRWPYPLRTGFVVATGVEPAAPGPLPRPVPTTPAGGGLALQNLSYAAQWWLFAGFGLLLWWRLVRDDHLGVLAVGPAGSPTPSRPSGGART